MTADQVVMSARGPHRRLLNGLITAGPLVDGDVAVPDDGGPEEHGQPAERGRQVEHAVAQQRRGPAQR